MSVNVLAGHSSSSGLFPITRVTEIPYFPFFLVGAVPSQSCGTLMASSFSPHINFLGLQPKCKGNGQTKLGRNHSPPVLF